MVKNIIVQSLMICSFGAPWGTNMNDLMSCWMELDGHGHCSPFRLCHSLLKNTNLFSVKWTNGSLSFSETVYLASLYNTDQGSRINQLLKKIWMSNTVEVAPRKIYDTDKQEYWSPLSDRWTKVVWVRTHG